MYPKEQIFSCYSTKNKKKIEIGRKKSILLSGDSCISKIIINKKYVYCRHQIHNKSLPEDYFQYCSRGQTLDTS